MLHFMMELMLAVAVFFGLPLLLVLIYRTNAGVMFLAACAGLVLLGSMDPAVVSAAGSVLSDSSEGYIRLGIVMVPIIFSALLFKHSTRTAQLPLQIIICLFIAMMLLLILPKQTGLPWLLSTAEHPVWQDIEEFLTILVAFGIALSLLAVMLRGHTSKKGRHHR